MPRALSLLTLFAFAMGTPYHAAVQVSPSIDPLPSVDPLQIDTLLSSNDDYDSRSCLQALHLTMRWRTSKKMRELWEGWVTNEWKVLVQYDSCIYRASQCESTKDANNVLIRARMVAAGQVHHRCRPLTRYCVATQSYLHTVGEVAG